MSGCKEGKENKESKEGKENTGKKTRTAKKYKYEVKWYHPLTENEICSMKFKTMREVINHKHIHKVSESVFWNLLKMEKQKQIDSRGIYISRLQ